MTRLQLSEADRELLRSWVRQGTAHARTVQRAKVLLAIEEGLSQDVTAAKLGCHRSFIQRTLRRFNEIGLESVQRDRTRTGRPKLITQDQESAVLSLTRYTSPEDATHWSVRTMSKVSGVSPATVQRIWAKHGIKPHLIRTFKLSKDPQFEEKLIDVVGLYLDPPESALVLCVDEKSQIQALDRTQPGLPMKKGRCETMTHDYKRYGTTTLFAALNALDGTVIGSCKDRHRHQEFLAFLKLIDRKTPKGLTLHLVLDNYSTHKHPEVKKWLATRNANETRFELHFVPTSCSWLNLVERFFALITTKRIRRGTFNSVAQLESAIMDFLKSHNLEPKPFTWTASTESIIEKIGRGLRTLETLH